MTQAGWVPGCINDRSITGFRIRHGSSRGPMSRAAYHRLKRQDRGPRETYVNSRITITAENEAAWDRANTEPVGGTEAKLQARVKKIRQERTAKMVKASLDSERHISKQRKGRTKKKPRA